VSGKGITLQLPQGRITVETEASGKALSWGIPDTGGGIQPRANIFRPFYATKGAGTGLGLSFACRIVEEHNIDVTSAVGKGSKFVLSLPLAGPIASGQLRRGS